MEDLLLSQLTEFNQTDKTIEAAYHEYAKHYGLSDCAFIILYLSWKSKEHYTQTDLCDEWFYSRQTVNSSLKKLEKEGLIRLALLEGNRKSKQICLTPKGRALAEQIIRPVIDAELSSLKQLTPEERKMMVHLTKKYSSLLHSEIRAILRNEKGL